MGFKSDSQRKGFFSNLRNSIHQSNLQRHDVQREKLLIKAANEKVKLRKQQESFASEAKVRLAKNDLERIKKAEVLIKKERFAQSHTGKFVAATKRGVQSAVDYEKAHGKDQLNQLKKKGNRLKQILKE